MPISQALKEVYASAPTTTRYIETLSFSHSRFSPQTFYLTNDNYPWTFLLETGTSVKFTTVPFRIVLPTIDKQGNQDLQLTIANIGQDLVDPLEAAITVPSEPIKCVYRVYLDQENSAPQNTPPLSLTIVGVQMTREGVAAVAGRTDVLNRAFPYNMYRLDLFPGLRR